MVTVSLNGTSTSSVRSLNADMIPNYLKRSSPTRLKPCAERMVDTCDVAATDGCCGVIPCKLCLEWEAYGEDSAYGSADFGGSSWSGTVGGGSFVAYWERNIYDECEFVVVFDGDEVYRQTCYDGASCRNPGGEASASIGYEEGTLRWGVYDARELPLHKDPEGGCRDFFCGDCRCSCRALCVDVREVVYGDFIDTYYGELTDTAYSDCDPPVWSGTIGNFEISLALGRDIYGNCIVTPTVNGDEGEAISVVGCSDMSGTVELYDGSSFTFRCKQCSCGQEIGDCICGRPIGDTLTLLFASANAPSTIHSVTLTYGQINEPGITCLPFSPGSFPGYSGRFTGTLAIPMGGSRTEGIDFRLLCECTNCNLCLYYRFDSTSPLWCVTFVDRTNCDCPALLTVDNLAGACDLWSYQIFDVTILESSGNC